MYRSHPRWYRPTYFILHSTLHFMYIALPLWNMGRFVLMNILILCDRNTWKEWLVPNLRITIKVGFIKDVQPNLLDWFTMERYVAAETIAFVLNI